MLEELFGLTLIDNAGKLSEAQVLEEVYATL